MKSLARIVSAFALLALTAGSAGAAEVGVGAALQSSPVAGALTVSGRLNPRLMLEGRLAPTFGDRNQLFLALDATADLGDGFETGAGRVLPFAGGGVRAHLIDDNGVGVEAPLGVRYGIPDAPLWLTMAVAPLIDIYPNVGPLNDTQVFFTLDARIGLVYVFGKPAKSGSSAPMTPMP